MDTTSPPNTDELGRETDAETMATCGEIEMESATRKGFGGAAASIWHMVATTLAGKKRKKEGVKEHQEGRKRNMETAARDVAGSDEMHWEDTAAC